MFECENCLQKFEIVQEDLDFYEMAAPTFSGKKFVIPPPTHCPDYRE